MGAYGGIALAVASAFGFWLLWRFGRSFAALCDETKSQWSISVFTGTDPLRLQADPLIGDRPVLEGRHVLDASAEYVADPFLLRCGDTWYLFFELLERKLWRGAIAFATSPDGRRWEYGRVVLREPFHLSYPQVLQSGDQVYMVPESARAGGVRLYRADPFPHHWALECTLIEGAFYDPSLVEFDGRWWMFAMDSSHSLRLFHSPQLRGQWVEHPASPVVKHCRRTARPGGRILKTDEGLVRFGQDGEEAYGAKLWAFRIHTLTVDAYGETELPGGPMFEGSGRGWNRTGMHHLDAQPLGDGTWIGAVDGNDMRRVFNWRAGLRRQQRKAVGAYRALLASGTGTAGSSRS